MHLSDATGLESCTPEGSRLAVVRRESMPGYPSYTVFCTALGPPGATSVMQWLHTSRWESEGLYSSGRLWRFLRFLGTSQDSAETISKLHQALARDGQRLLPCSQLPLLLALPGD